MAVWDQTGAASRFVIWAADPQGPSASVDGDDDDAMLVAKTKSISCALGGTRRWGATDMQHEQAPGHFGHLQPQPVGTGFWGQSRQSDRINQRGQAPRGAIPWRCAPFPLQYLQVYDLHAVKFIRKSPCRA